MRTVPVLFTEPLPSFHFKSKYLVALDQFVDNFCFYYGFYRITHCNGSVAFGHQYFGKLHRVAGFARNTGNLQAVARFYFELLACYFYYC
jgi:hypothetical protein